jgi:hypothetical protein
MSDLRLPAYAKLQSAGMPADFVRQGVEIVRRDVGLGLPTYPDVGIDVRPQSFDRSMRPEDVTAAVYAAAKGRCRRHYGLAQLRRDERWRI